MGECSYWMLIESRLVGKCEISFGESNTASSTGHCPLPRHRPRS